MDPWGNFGWNGQDQRPPPDSMQELAHRLLLAQQQQEQAQQQQQQNYNGTQGTSSTYYPTNNYPGDDEEPIAFDYQYQVSQHANELRGQQNQMSLQQYQQQQSFTQGDEPIDIDTLVIQEAVARRPNQFDGSTFTMPSAFDNTESNRQLLAAIAAQQPVADTGRMALDPTSLSAYTGGDGDMLEEPAQKRAKLQVAGAASGLSRLVQRGPYSPSWQENDQPRGEGADYSDNVDTLVDSIFDDDTVRESFRADENVGAPLELTSGDSSIIENNSQNHGHQAKEVGFEEAGKGIFDDAEDDAELPSAFSQPQRVPGGNSIMDQKPPALLSVAKRSSDDATQAASNDTQADADQKGRKKRSKPKPKQPLIKPLARATPKETKNATTILKNKTDLSLVLPQNACHLLASKFWIVTVQQFEHVFDPSSEAYDGPSMRAFRDEIKDAIAERIVSEKEAADGVNTIAGGIEPTDLERLLLVSQKDDKIGVSPSASFEGPSADLTQEHAGTKEDADESRERPVPTNGDGIHQHDLFMQPAAVGLHDETSVNDIVMDEQSLLVESSRNESSDVHNETSVNDIMMGEQSLLVESSRNESSDVPAGSLGNSEINVHSSSHPRDEALVTSLLGDTRVVTADSLVEFIEPDIAKESGFETVETQTGDRPRDDVITAPMGGETRNATSDERKITAERILESWTNRLANWKHIQPELDSSDTHTSAFSLEHAIGMFLPTTIRNFLSSISVSTAFEFLSIRFTESSPGIQALFAWRKLCGLEDVKPELLAKHMAGLALRLDKALSSMPPIDAYSRQWMGTALICVTAAAKEFLIDHCKLHTPEEFLDGRTSDFSEKLVKWRKSKNKTVLKGSGRVAMVSSFKAQVRACVVGETGNGRVTTEDEIIEQSKLMSPADYVVEVEGGRKDKSKPKPVKLKVKKEESGPPKLTQKQKQLSETLLNSVEFLEKALGTENAEFLAMNGIHSPEQLYSTENEDMSSLVIEMAKWKTATSNEEVQVEACEKSLSEWKAKVKDEINQAVVHSGREAAKKSPPKLKVAKSNGSAPKRLRSRSSKSLDDPLQTLSSTALAFLKTIDITTGEEFLETRTSEIASALVEWREKEKMVPLKGSGCSATVSGWKAAVRKAAETSGDESVSAMEATLQSNKRSLQVPPLKSTAPPKIKIDTVSHPYLLQGLPRRKFLVRNSTDPNFVYEFELSVRKPKRGLGVYLTFRGARRVRSLDGIPESGSKLPKPMVHVGPPDAADGPVNAFLPVLQDVSVSTKTSNASTDTFASSHTGCGIIEVGRYGAIPLSATAPVKAALTLVEDFLMIQHSQNPISAVQSDPALNSDSNVLVEVSPQFGTQCFFYTSDLMEKGQVTELRFSQPVSKISSIDLSGSPCFVILDRLSLIQSLAALSLADLLSVIALMSKIADSNSREIRAGAQREQVGGDQQPQQPRNLTEEVKLQMVKRRGHWLASQILYILETPRETTSPAEQKLVVDKAKRLLMTTEECSNFCAFTNQAGDESLQTELSHEILCGAVQRNPSVNWLDKSTWCDISARLLRDCLRKASAHMTSNCFDLGDDNKDRLLKDFEGLVIEAAKQVISDETDKANLALKIQRELNDTVVSSIDRDFLFENYERLPKEVVAKASQVEAYRNSMELCSEVAYDDSITTPLCDNSEQCSVVVATKSPWSPSSAIMRSMTDVEQKAAQIDTKWYIENHVLFVATTIASSAQMQCMLEKTDPDTESHSAYSRFAAAVRSLLESDPTHGNNLMDLDSFEALSERDSELKLLPNEILKSSTKNPPVPCPLPLFLADVWPRLKAVYGFSIEVGDDPTDITFFPPGHQGQFHRASERQIGLQRLEKARKRRKVEQQVRGVGFGEIQKLTKRIFVSATRDDIEPGQGASVKDALKQFVVSVLSEMTGGDNEECRRRMAAIETAVSQFFDEMIPSMLANEKSVGEDSGSLECAYLMQVMLVLPSLLEQSGLSMRRVEDTMGVIRDLAQFVSSKNDELFPEPLRVCHEEYAPGHDVHRPFLSPRLQKLASQPLDSEAASGGEGSELVREIIQPEDMHELSGFICTVLSQLLPCRATEYDLLSKGRATKGRTVGYPGLMCKHCAGKSTDGRFFFTSLDSLNTAATATLGHMYRCQFIPDELKKRIANLKTRHPEERKALKHGAQAQFFARLWKRLWSAEGIPDTPVVLTNHQNVATDEKLAVATNDATLQQQESQPSIEFKSHTDLLTFLATTAPWNTRADILERIQQYYEVIAHGGEIYNTNAMPTHFNSEWILSQMVPPERLETHQTFLSG